MDIVRLSEDNYKDILDNFPLDDLSPISDSIAYLPHKNEIISRFILDLKIDVKDIIENLLDSEKIEVLVSTVIYSKRLGVDLSFDEVKISPLGDLGPIPMSEVSKIKVLEYLERIRQFILESEGIHLEEEDVFPYFYTIAILRNFKFSISECLGQLKDDKVTLSCIAFLSDSEEPAYLLSLALKIISPENEAHLLSLMGFMDKRFRDLLITFSNSSYDQFVDDETRDVMEGLLPPSRDIPPIKPLRKEDFTISKDKEKFFNDFCLLGSPSVSHFLSYLEIYKEHFILTEDEQRLFVDIFNRIFENRKSFSRIILSKMVLFGILDKRYK